MHQALIDVCEKLDSLSATMLSKSNDERRATEIWAWHLPAISPVQLAAWPNDLAQAIHESGPEELSDNELKRIELVLSCLEGIELHISPNIYKSPQQGIPAYTASLSYITGILSPLCGWINVSQSALPNNIARRLQKAERDLSRITPEQLELEKRIKEIIDAHDAAQALPTTMQELKDTQSELRSIWGSASEYLGKIEEDRKKSLEAVDELKKYSEEGDNYLSRLSAAYSAATTQGLAAAFEDRARKLNSSVVIWVICLALGLGVLMVVGAVRLNAMKDTLAGATFETGKVWVQVFLSALSVGAPVWFSWVATKQISQRFRLAEDYAFKASVAKAYEGFRKEAIRIDPEMEKRLFASALKRLDEAPLRLMEMTTHGSPLHEVTDSYIREKANQGLSKVVDTVSKHRKPSLKPSDSDSAPVD